MTLHEFVLAADRQVVKLFEEKGCVLAMYHIIDGQGREILAPAPDGDPDIMMVMVREAFAELEVKRYVFITEAWMGKTDESNIAQLKEYMKENSLEHRAGRKEVILFSAEDEAEGGLMGMREIIRPAGDAPLLGPLDLQQYSGIEGRMVGLLPRRGASH